MKRVIDRKLYDTGKAEQIANYAPITDTGDFDAGFATLHRESCPHLEYS